MKEKKCIVIIPIYKDIEIVEKTSLNSLIENLDNKYSICIIGCDEKLIDKYTNYLNNKFYVSSSLFDKKYFKSTSTYSHLLKSYDFYNTFKEYDYMLIFQTDTLMSSNNSLDYWINKDYDYVGAPILVNTSGWKNTPCVGNGGCSLRKISYFLDITNPNGDFLNTYKDKLEKEVSARGKEGYDNFEDLYFAELVSYYNGMNKPHFKEAINFSWDMNTDIAYNINKTVPMFIHAFDKNLRWYDKNTNFKNEIKDYKELYDFCEDKYKELHKFYQNKI